MEIQKKDFKITGYENSLFYISAEGVVTTTLTQMSKFTQGRVFAVSAPVWQLCDSRHENPIANMGGIFPKCLMNPMFVDGMTKDIVEKLRGRYSFGDTLFCVVTGMSTALVSLINACAALDVRLNLFHYDVVHDCYQMQKVSNFYIETKIAMLERLHK